MSEHPDASLRPHSHRRWRFLRDVAVFQFKLFLDNLRDFALVPVSLVAAALDLLITGEHEGARFYKVLRWSWHSERIIDLYSMIETDEEAPLGHDFTVDGVLLRVEGAILREYARGGTAAAIKEAVDRVLDRVQRRGGPSEPARAAPEHRAAEDGAPGQAGPSAGQV